MDDFFLFLRKFIHFFFSFSQGKQIFLTYEGVNVILSYMKPVQKVRNARIARTHDELLEVLT